MRFKERRYKRHFCGADYGKFLNAIYDALNWMFGFMPSSIFYGIGSDCDKNISRFTRGWTDRA